MHDLPNFWNLRTTACLGIAVASSIALSGCAESPSPADQTSGLESPTASELVESGIRLRETDTLILAQKSFELGEYDQTIEQCTSLLRHDWGPADDRDAIKKLESDVFYLRGRAFLAKNFPQIAINDFDDAIRRGDNDLKSKAFLARAKADSELERWSQTVSDSSESIRLAPDNGEAYLVRGRALENQGHVARANSSLAEAKRLGVVFQSTLKPGTEPAKSSLEKAQTFLEAGNPVVAREILEEQLLNGIETAETATVYAQCLYAMDEYYASVVSSTRAIGLNPRNATAYRIRGLSHFQRRSFDIAIKDLVSAITLDPALSDSLNPWLEKARQRGGMAPSIRALLLEKAREVLARQDWKSEKPDQREQWLLDLMRMIKAPDQIQHFENLLAQQPERSPESLRWVADYLMLDRKTPAVKDIRDYLNLQSAEGSSPESQIWTAIESRSSAIQNGLTVYPDIGAYAIEYKFLALLQRTIDAEIVRLKFDHLYQSIQSEDPSGLKLMLPQISLLENEPARLLRDCIEQDRKIHAMLIIDKYEQSLNWEIAEFLVLDQ